MSTAMSRSPRAADRGTPGFRITLRIALRMDFRVMALLFQDLDHQQAAALDLDGDEVNIRRHRCRPEG